MLKFQSTLSENERSPEASDGGREPSMFTNEHASEPKYDEDEVKHFYEVTTQVLGTMKEIKSFIKKKQ